MSKQRQAGRAAREARREAEEFMADTSSLGVCRELQGGVPALPLRPQPLSPLFYTKDMAPSKPNNSSATNLPARDTTTLIPSLHPTEVNRGGAAAMPWGPRAGGQALFQHCQPHHTGPSALLVSVTLFLHGHWAWPIIDINSCSINT